MTATRTRTPARIHGITVRVLPSPKSSGWPSAAVLLLAVWACLAAAGARAEPSASDRWDDAEIERVVRLGCDRDHPIERYRGGPRDHEMLGPLWLVKAGDSDVRGVLVPTFVRLYLFGRSRGCRPLDLEEARTLATEETWVVLWRFEDPPRPFSASTSSDQKVLHPVEVELRASDARIPPKSTRDRDSLMASIYGADWNQGESLLAAFNSVPRDGALRVEWLVEEDGRKYLRETEFITLSLLPQKWWDLAHGIDEPATEEGKNKKRKWWQ